MSLRHRFLVPIVALGFLGAACGSGDAGGGSAGDGIPVTLRDFSIEMSETSSPAGTVDFDITNDGPSVHEFEVLRTDTPADALPVESSVVQTTAEGIEIVDEIEQITPSTDAGLSVALDPATYAVICNIAGHYEAGMYTSFTVT